MSTLRIITLVLLIIGGLNWGLVGLFNFDLVAAIFGAQSLLSRVVYCLVGLSALFQLTSFNLMMNSREDEGMRLSR